MGHVGCDEARGIRTPAGLSPLSRARRGPAGDRRPSSGRSTPPARASASTSSRASLFAVAAERDPGAAARTLAALLTDEVRLRRDESSLDGLWLDKALERRAGHPLALAVIAAEIGRRAGLSVGICSTAWGWYAGIGEPERLWLIDPSTEPGPTPSGPVRSHCGHEVAFAALTGVYARLVRDGDEAAAHHAVRLRGRLPVTRHGS